MVSRKQLIPDPAGFNDPTKKAAARQERALDAAEIAGAGAFSIGAVVAGLAASVATGGIVTAAGAGVLAGVKLLKLRSRWVKDDPPRDDFAHPKPFRAPSLRMLDALYAVVQEALPEPIREFARLGERMFLASGALEATILNAERAQGALLAEEPRFARRRFSDSRGNALFAADLLRVTADSCFQSANTILNLPTDHQSMSQWAGQSFLRVIDDDPIASRVVRQAGIDLDLLGIPVPAEIDPDSFIIFRSTLRSVGRGAVVFAEALDHWGSEPPPSKLAPLPNPASDGGAGLEKDWAPEFANSKETEEQVLEPNEHIHEATETA